MNEYFIPLQRQTKQTLYENDIKHKEFQSIQDKEKFDIENHYLIEKKRREMMKEDVKKI